MRILAVRRFPTKMPAVLVVTLLLNPIPVMLASSADSIPQSAIRNFILRNPQSAIRNSNDICKRLLRPAEIPDTEKEEKGDN
jgi:hypothetical protein